MVIVLGGLNAGRPASILTIGGDNAATANYQGIIVESANQNSSFGTAGTFGGSIVKIGTGDQTFSGINYYAGATTVKGGILTVTTLADGGVATTASAADAGTTTLNVSSTAGLVVGQSLEASGLARANLPTITAIGVNSVTLSAAQTIANSTPLYFGNGNGLGISTNAASNLVLDGGTLQYTGTATTTDRLFTVGSTVAGATGTLDASGTGALTFSNPGSVAYGTNNQTRTLVLTGTSTAPNTLAPLIADNGTGAVSVTKTGLGNWSLTNTNSYSGGTTVNSGTLTSAVAGGFGTGDVTVAPTGTTLAGSATLNSTGSIASTALVTVNTNTAAIGTVNFNGATPTIGGLSGNGSAVLNNATGTALTVGSTNNLSSTFGGVISEGTAGKGSLTKAGTGTLTLSGANTYTGTTLVSAGNLRVTGSIGSGAVTVGNNTATSATLSGTGVVGANVITSTTSTNVAYLAPGVNSTGSLSNFGGVGTLTIGGTLTLGVGTVLDYDLTGATTTGGGVNDFISVGGGLVLTMTSGSTTFDFTGSTLNTTGSTYTLISAGTSITGFDPSDFAALGLPTGTTATFTKSGNNLQVSFSTLLAAGYFNGSTTGNLNSASAYDTTQSGTTVAANAPTSTTDIFFSNDHNTVNTGTITGAALSVKSVTFGTGTGTNSGITITSDNNTTHNLTIANGITVLAGAGNDTISAPVVLGASQTWANGSSGALAVSGGVTGTADLALQANSTGAINLSGGSVNNVGSVTNSGTGSGATTISAVIGSNVTGVTQNSTTSNLVLTGANLYSGTTTVTAGTLYANNTSGSATGSSQVNVANHATLAGTGTITPGSGKTISLAAYSTLVSGIAQTGISTTPTKGLTINNTPGTTAVLDAHLGNVTLSFDLGAGNTGLLHSTAGDPVYQFGNPDIDSSYLTLNGNTPGEIAFAGSDTIQVNDLSNGGLHLNLGIPYLLITAYDNAAFTGIKTNTGTNTLGVANNGWVTNLSLNFQGGTYPNGEGLYLYNGNLEVVPEPSTWALMLGGLAVLILIQRRKNRSN